MEWYTATLTFLAAISWPVVASVLLIKIWPKVKDRFGDLRSFKAGGAEVVFEQAEAAASLASAVEVRDQVDDSDQKLEEIVRSFAEAGWAMGSSGRFSGKPDPVIEWSDEGRPHVAGWTGEKRRASPALTVTEAELLSLYRKMLETSGLERGILNEKYMTLRRRVERYRPDSVVLKLPPLE